MPVYVEPIGVRLHLYVSTDGDFGWIHQSRLIQLRTLHLRSEPANAAREYGLRHELRLQDFRVLCGLAGGCGRAGQKLRTEPNNILPAYQLRLDRVD